MWGVSASSAFRFTPGAEAEDIDMEDCCMLVDDRTEEVDGEGADESV